MITVCLLSYYAPGVMPVREHLENGALLNPHGHGWAAGPVMSRSPDDPECMIRRFLEERRIRLHVPALFHSRNATGDSPVTRQNIHPFAVIQGREIMTVAHNGYLFPHDGGRSDSLIFATEILPRYDLDDEESVRLLEQRMGPNKAVILRPGKPGLILNKHLGIAFGPADGTLNGTWHSNADYTGVPHLIAGICPQCAAETDQKPVCGPCEGRAQCRQALLMSKVKGGEKHA